MTKAAIPGSPHETLRLMIEQAGGAKRAADFEGVSEFTLYKQLNPEDATTEMSYVRVSRIASKFSCTAPAEHMALLAKGRFVPDLVVDAAACDMTAICELAARSADALGEYAKARRDNDLTPDEARLIRKELHELLVSIHGADIRLARIEQGEGTP
jgi:hypothetical protein